MLSTAPSGRVLEFHEKPREPACIPGEPGRVYASMGNYLFEPRALERILDDARHQGDTDFGRDILPRVCAAARTYAYDFAANEVPGVQDFEERAYWRDVGTLSALAAAQQDAMGPQPRFNLWNRRWPIRGEHDAALLAKLRTWKGAQPVAEGAPAADAEVMPAAAWLASGSSRDRHSDERRYPS